MILEFVLTMARSSVLVNNAGLRLENYNDQDPINMDDLRSRLGELPRDQQIAAYCQVGMRGYLATRILLQSGFSAANLGGGYKTYKLFE